MIIREITTEGDWDTFLDQQKPNTFLQSWAWGEIQKKSGEDVWRLGLYADNVLRGVALLIGVKARRGNFLLIPHGPILTRPEDMESALSSLIAYIKQHMPTSMTALRIAPLLLNAPEYANLFSRLGFRNAPLHIHAELTWVRDIDKNDEELLQGMRKTTRHAIRKGQQSAIQVEILTDITGLERFWPLYERTTSRHGFVPFTRDVIRHQVEEFSLGQQIYIPIARYEGRDVAAAIVMISGDTAFYYHGASEKLPASVPAAHLLHWESMKYARAKNLKHYNFWGIAQDHEINHPFYGITIFKKGFGGYALDYMHAQDFPLTLGYWKLWAVEMIRKVRRGF